MRPNAQVFEQVGNLGTDKRRELSFDAKSLAHTMGVLTRLYTDPIGTCIRETSVNAWDSHVEAKQDRPIEVTLPSELSPYFIVQDFGTGMSESHLLDIYSKYGASTKRETDDQAGMLGLGCKSPLAYTDQFTITAIYDGVRREAVFSRSDDGAGFIQILGESPTDERNGVTIKIPVGRHDSREFVQKAKMFFAFWPEGTVDLIGTPIPELEGEWLEEGAVLLQKHDQRIGTKVGLRTFDGDTVVMGGVPYPVPPDHSVTKALGHGTYATMFVPIGTVDPAPSREALELTNRTKEFLRDAQQWIRDTSLRRAQEDVEAQATACEARAAAMGWMRHFGYGISRNLTFTYKGHKVPTDHSYDLRGRGFVVSFDDEVRASYEEAQIALPTSADLTSGHLYSKVSFVTDFPVKILSGNRRKSLIDWMDSKFDSHWRRRVVVLYRDESQSIFQWMSNNLDITSWDDIIEQFPVESTAGHSSSSDLYRVMSSTDGLVSRQLADSEEIVYMAPSDIADHYGDTKVGSHPSNWDPIRSLKDLVTPSVTLVLVNKNRWEKLVRNHPDATHVTDWMRSLNLNEIIDRDKIVPRRLNEIRIREADTSKIRDPELVELLETSTESIRLRKILIAYERAQTKVFRYSGSAPKWPDLNGGGHARNLYRKMELRYPIVFGMSRYHSHSNIVTDDLIEYVNLKYDAIQAGKN